MERIKIKPLSVNDAWRGGPRYRTNEYKSYEKMLTYLLPKLTVPKGKLHLTLKVGLSSKGCDLDNVIKPFQDIISKQYGFNDNKIYKLEVEKVDCKKGEEYIEFLLTHINE